jgi:predicted PurR-regulated permease PerM
LEKEIMTTIKDLKFWRILLFSILGIVFFMLIWLVRGILTPFLLGFFLAYLFSPIVKFLERKGFSRGPAIALVYLGFIALVAPLIIFGVPEMFKEINEFAESLPKYVAEVQNQLLRFHEQYKQSGLPSGVVRAIDGNLLKIEDWLVHKLEGIINLIIGLVAFLPLLILSPVLSIYFLYDWERMKSGLKEAVPHQWRSGAIHVGQEVSLVLRKFLRGNLTVATMVGLLIGLGMKLIGMDYALLIGVISGLFDLVPYFGPVIGAIPALALALLKSPTTALWVLVVIIVVQQVESNIIQPKIVGKSLGLHPLVVVFVLLAGGSLYGFWGMLLAVPVAGMLRVLLTYIYLKLV